MDSKMSADQQFVQSLICNNDNMNFSLTPTQNGDQGLFDYSAGLDSASFSLTGSIGSPGRLVGASIATNTFSDTNTNNSCAHVGAQTQNGLGLLDYSASLDSASFSPSGIGITGFAGGFDGSTTSNTLAQENSIVSGNNNTSCAHGATSTTNNDPLSIMHMLHARGTSFKCNGTGQIIIDTGIGGGGLHSHLDGASQLATTTSSHPTLVSTVSSDGSTIGTITSTSPSPPPQQKLKPLKSKKIVDFTGATFCLISFEGCEDYSIDPSDKKLLEMNQKMNLLVVGVLYRDFPNDAVRACCPYCRATGNYYTEWLTTPASLDTVIAKLRALYKHMKACPNRRGATLQDIGTYSYNSHKYPKDDIVKLLEKNNFANATKGGGFDEDQSEGKFTLIIYFISQYIALTSTHMICIPFTVTLSLKQGTEGKWWCKA